MNTPISGASPPSPQVLAAAYEECRRVTRTEARNFYFAFLTLPARQRRAIYVAYTFCRYCDDSRGRRRNHGPETGARKLSPGDAGQKRMPDTLPNRFSSASPTSPLRMKSRRHYFEEVLNGVESDLVKTRYANFDELREYCYRVASVVGLICIHIFGYRGGDEARQGAIDLGLAMQLTNICRDVREELGIWKGVLATR